VSGSGRGWQTVLSLFCAAVGTAYVESSVTRCRTRAACHAAVWFVAHGHCGRKLSACAFTQPLHNIGGRIVWWRISLLLVLKWLELRSAC
jgi:hypothetical protein